MYRIGIDLGGTNTAAGLVDENGRIIDRANVKTCLPTTLERITQNITALCLQLMEKNNLTKADILRVGVGVPCTANTQTGCMEDADHLGFPGGALVQPLEEALGLPVAMGNDANCAAWGEYKAGGYEGDSFLLVTLGTGIGGGIIANGQLLEGVNFAAGELGHMMLYAGGEDCTCGRKGCFEAHGSATALIRQANRVLPQPITEAKAVFDGAAAGNGLCQQLLDTYTECLADGFANLIKIFGPAHLCIGGGISHAGDALLIPVQEKTMARIYAKTAKQNTKIVLARLGNDAGIIGAALL